MRQLFQSSKAFSSGIIFYFLSFLFAILFIGTAFIVTDQFTRFEPALFFENNTTFLFLVAIGFFFGILTFAAGTFLIAQFLAGYGFAKPVTLQQRLQWGLRFFGILVIFPVYSLIVILLAMRKKSPQQKLFYIPSSVFGFFLFLPVWICSSLLLIASVAYIAGSAIGFAPVIEHISGTGSMYPTFPKGTGATDKENAEQTVATVFFWKYPGGITFFDKRYFGHTLERGDIVAFENETTAEITTKQYGTPSGFVKRVIGVPGDSLELRDGLVLINNRPLKEPYTASPRSTFAEAFLHECTRITIPIGSVFVMGDNRKGSGDSREFGLVPEKDIDSVLPLSWQRGEWAKNWRDTSQDLDDGSRIRLNKQEYVALLNDRRKAAGVPQLKYQTKLEQSATKRAKTILNYNDFSFEASRSGYTMSRAMSDVNYFNPVYGESPTQGYFTAEELIENQFAFPQSSEFLLERDYDEVGIAEIQGQINGCPTQIIVQHFAGYVPPDYSQEDIQSWKDALANLKEIQPGWEELKKNGEFYFKHTSDIDRINSLISQRIANVSTILAKMEANQWLSVSDKALVEEDEELSKQINELAKKLNETN
ncbi:MAG TPA: signal peptidase I [Patescibacteria group bacterium]|nr:signal peptidase I [Patescibacteria group bacterium]